jgi:hypothetical protein
MSQRFDMSRAPQMRALPRLWGNAGSYEPSVAQTEAFNAFAHVGDPTADALVAAIKGERGQEIRRQFEVALEHGIDAVVGAPDELVAFFCEAEAIPYWLDQKKLDRACEVFASIGPLAGPMLMVGLAFTYATKDGNDVLLRSGDARDKAGKRAVETLAWVKQVTDHGGLAMGADGYRSSLRVRLTHAFMRSGMSKRDDWDNPHLAVNQRVFSNTIVAFAVYPTVANMLAGRYFTRKERAAVFHLWRYVAHLVGVNPLLMAADEDDMLRLFVLALREQIHPDDDALLLGSALVAAYPEIYGITGQRRQDVAARWAIDNVHGALARLTLGPTLSDSLGFPRVSPLAVPLLAAAAAGSAAFSSVDLVPPLRRARSAFMGRLETSLLDAMMMNVRGDVNATFRAKQEAFGATPDAVRAR